MVKLPLSKLNDLFALINGNQELYLPVDTDKGEAEYKKWQEGYSLSSALNTNRSAKDFFFPQTENIVEFKMEGKNIDVIDTRSETKDFVVFGVKACDAKSFEILDRVFLVDPVDTFYKNRREHGTIVTLSCNTMAPTCFCSLFNIDVANPAGDVASWMDDETIWFEANTEKGKNFLASISSLTENTNDADVDAVEELKDATTELMNSQALAKQDMAKFKGENLLELFNSPEWEKLSETCLGCGTCTFVCPTCQCYDIRDFNTGKGVKRFRCWDSCMYSDFTKMAAENPRKSQLERFRQRFMHKLVYYPTKNEGIYGCVGCGRCLNKCPISMNIVKVIKKLSNTKGDN
jgi:heterodisulfide reductase subunit C